MFKPITLSAVLALALLAAPAARAAARPESPDAFAAITTHYEAIHHALLRDTLDGVAPNARAIRDQAVKLYEHFSAEAAGDAATTVAYCPMAKKAWLQKEGEAIGNPYYGQEMPRCGSFVAKRRGVEN